MLIHADADKSTSASPATSSSSPSPSSSSPSSNTFSPAQRTRPIAIQNESPPSSKKAKRSLDYVIRSGLAGGIAGCAAKTLIAPLDRVKILFQTSNKRFTKYTGSWVGVARAMRDIYGQDGTVGLFRGHSMTLLRIFPYAAIKFVAYEQIRAVVIRREDQETHLRRLFCGAFAGVSSVFCTYPLDVVRVRLAFETKKNYHGNVFTIFREIYRERPAAVTTAGSAPTASAVGIRNTAGAASYTIARAASTVATSATNIAADSLPRAVTRPFSGIANFYRGFSMTLLGMLPYAGVSFLAHDLAHDWLREEPLAKYTVVPNSGTLANADGEGYTRSTRPKLRVWADLAAGAFAGLCSQTASYPLEVIRRRMQVGGVTGSGKFLGGLETAGIIMREKGIKGFYVGLTIGYIKVLPMAATAFFVYGRAKSALGIS